MFYSEVVCNKYIANCPMFVWVTIKSDCEWGMAQTSERFCLSTIIVHIPN